MFKKVDTYVAVEVIKPFLGTSLFFFFTFFLFQTLRLADFLIVHHVPPGIVGKIAFCLLLSFSPLVFPIAFLAAVLLGFGRLSGDSELVALKSLGVSMSRMSRPALLSGIVVAILSGILSLEISPWAEREMSAALLTAGSTRVVTDVKAHTFNNFFDLILYTDAIDENTGRMTKVFLSDERDPQNPSIVVAKSGYLQSIRTEHDLSRKELLVLQNGSIHQLPLPGSKEAKYDRVDFENYSLYLRVDVNERMESHHPRMQSFATVWKHTWDYARNVPLTWRIDYVTEFLKRLNYSLAPILFCFLGVGLGTIRTRAAGSKGILITFVAALGYWQLLITAITFSNDMKVGAFWAMSVPNLVVGIAGFWAYRKASW